MPSGLQGTSTASSFFTWWPLRRRTLERRGEEIHDGIEERLHAHVAQ